MGARSNSPFHAPRAIFWTALALRLAVIAIGHTYRVPVADDHFKFAFENGRIARALVTGRGYADPFGGGTGPTAWTPPLFPLLVALSFRLFGVYTAAAAAFVLAVNSVASAFTAVLIYEIAARCCDAQGLARRTSRHAAPVALWSAWLWALYPAALQYAVHWLWETAISTMLFTWIIVTALRLRGIGLRQEGMGDAEHPWLSFRGEAEASASPAGSAAAPQSHPQRELPAPAPQRHTRLLWLAYGLLWGLLTLSNASLLLCLPTFTAWVLWPQRRRLKLATPARPLLAAIAFAAVMAPWWARNEHTFGRFIATRSNFPIELSESLKPEHWALPYTTVIPTSPVATEHRLYARMGELPYAAMRGVEARTQFRSHRRMFAINAVDRFFFFWDNVPHPPDRHPAQEYLRSLSYAFLSACGLLGLALAVHRRVPGAMLMLLAFAFAPLAYYFVIVQPRFRHPIEPLIAILAVYLVRSAEPSATPPTGPAREA